MAHPVPHTPRTDPALAASLLAMRLAAAGFMLVWSVEKIVAPDVARRVMETFYASSPSDTVLIAGGIAQTAIVLAFAAGLFRFVSYGAILLMHLASVAVTVPRLMDPYTLPNHLFWAAVPVLALLVVLFALRRRDAYTVDAALERRRSAG